MRSTHKIAPLNMRTTRKLRTRIEAAAKASGRSLVAEVEHRVEMSFVRQRTDAINDAIAKLQGGQDDLTVAVLGIGHERAANNAMLKQLINILLDGPMALSTEQRGALRDMLKTAQASQ